MQKELNLKEKEKRWIEALRRKEECRTDEEFDYEVLSETLYEDEEYIFFKECNKFLGRLYKSSFAKLNTNTQTYFGYIAFLVLNSILDKRNLVTLVDTFILHN